jgi:hypothetical protein
MLMAVGALKFEVRGWKLLYRVRRVDRNRSNVRCSSYESCWGSYALEEECTRARAG